MRLILITILLLMTLSVHLLIQVNGQNNQSLSEVLETGAAHLQRNEIPQAIKALRKAVAIDPQSATAHQLLGQAYYTQNTYEMMGEAKSEFVQALAIDPTLIWSRFYLARIYIDLGFAQKAADQLNEALKMRPQIPHLISLLGEAERLLSHPDKSIELNKKALQLDPSFFPARYYLGLAFIDMKMEIEAIVELEAAAKSGATIPDIYLTLGSIHSQKGNYDIAIELFSKAKFITPSRPEAHLKLGQVYRLQKKFDMALDELKLAFPDPARVMNTAYYQRLQAEVYYEMGLNYKEKKDIDQAEKAFAKARELDPQIGK